MREDCVIEVLSRPKRILGSSPQVQSLQKIVQQAASIESPILIYGERGSGREFVAEILHQSGSRRDEPFETMSCVGWSEELIERELDRKLERASNGILFLDDVNEVPPRILVKAMDASARIIAACDSALDAQERASQFGIRITLPPLRDRKLDIPILVDHFVDQWRYRIRDADTKPPLLRMAERLLPAVTISPVNPSRK